MSLVDFLLGNQETEGNTGQILTGSSATDTTQLKSESGTTQQSQKTVGAQNTTGGQQTQSAQTTQQLSNPVQDKLSQTVLSFLDSVQNPTSNNTKTLVANAGNAAQNLTQTGQQVPAQVMALLDSLNAGITQQYNETEGASVSQAQQAIGSVDNSASQELRQRGGRNLAVALQSGDAQAIMQALQLQGSELNAGANALQGAAGTSLTADTAGNSNAAAVSQLLSILKGSTSTTSAAQDVATQQNTETQQTQNTIQEILNSILTQQQQGTQTKQATTADSDVTNNATILSWLKLLSNPGSSVV